MQGVQQEEIAVKVLAVEQRLTMILMGHWQSLRKGQPCPRAAAFDESTIARYLTDCVILCRLGSMEKWECRTVGRSLAARSQVTYLPLSIEEIAPDTLLHLTVQMLPTVAKSSRPNICEGEFVDRRDGPCLYRGILLPFVDASGEVSLVLGGARCKPIRVVRPR